MMTDEELVLEIISLSKKSDMDSDYKNENLRWVVSAIDSDENVKLISDFLSKKNITFESLIDFIDSISPEVEYVDDDDE